jgi:hypothetical protein
MPAFGRRLEKAGKSAILTVYGSDQKAPDGTAGYSGPKKRKTPWILCGSGVFLSKSLIF